MSEENLQKNLAEIFNDTVSGTVKVNHSLISVATGGDFDQSEINDIKAKLQEEKLEMLANNKGCAPEDASKMEVDDIKGDGNCLFNSMIEALELDISP